MFKLGDRVTHINIDRSNVATIIGIYDDRVTLRFDKHTHGNRIHENLSIGKLRRVSKTYLKFMEGLI